MNRASYHYRTNIGSRYLAPKINRADPLAVLLGNSIHSVYSYSKIFDTYEECAKHAVEFLKSELEVLNQESKNYSIFFRKNPFTDEPNGFKPLEVIQIYLAGQANTVLTDPIELFTQIFAMPKVDTLAQYHQAPTTLQ